MKQIVHPFFFQNIKMLQTFIQSSFIELGVGEEITIAIGQYLYLRGTAGRIDVSL